MSDWLAILSQYAFEAGYAGLFALSVIDSAGVPTSAAPDVVLILLAAVRPAAVVAAFLVAVAVSGSTAGCFALYGLGRRGGRLQWFATAQMERARASVDRHGAWVVFLAVLAPPPIPTKLFVLCAGLARVAATPFLLATVAGRLIRYGIGAAVGVSYGPRALDVIREGSPSALAALGVLVLVAVAVGIIRWSWRRDSDAE